MVKFGEHSNQSDEVLEEISIMKRCFIKKYNRNFYNLLYINDKIYNKRLLEEEHKYILENKIIFGKFLEKNINKSEVGFFDCPDIIKLGLIIEFSIIENPYILFPRELPKDFPESLRKLALELISNEKKELNKCLCFNENKRLKALNQEYKLFNNKKLTRNIFSPFLDYLSSIFIDSDNIDCLEKELIRRSINTGIGHRVYNNG